MTERCPECGLQDCARECPRALGHPLTKMSSAALDELARLSQELGLYDDTLLALSPGGVIHNDEGYPMNSPKVIAPGERVGAICRSNSQAVYLYGYGVYRGDDPCPLLDGAPNPKIELDDGKVIWGCMCWWGREDYVKDYIGERQVIPEPIPEIN